MCLWHEDLQHPTSDAQACCELLGGSLAELPIPLGEHLKRGRRGGGRLHVRRSCVQEKEEKSFGGNFAFSNLCVLGFSANFPFVFFPSGWGLAVSCCGGLGSF